MIVLKRSILLTGIFLFSAGAFACLDEDTKHSLYSMWEADNAIYQAYNQFPQSRDSDLFAVVQTKTYRCQTTHLTGPGFEMIKKWPLVDGCTRTGDGIACELSFEKFLESTEVCEIWCRKI